MNDLKSLFIDPSASVRQALKKLDQTAMKCVLVANNEGRLLGVLTDGDIRRCLLNGLDLDKEIDGIYNPNPISISKKEFSLIKAKEILIKENITIIPIVSEDGIVEEIISLSDILSEKAPKLKRSESINIPAVIMAGGKGTRLKPFTNILPKPLMPIGDITILEKIMNHFSDLGCDNQSIILNHKSNLIMSYLETLNNSQLNLNYLKESKFLGTAGGLSLAKDKVVQPNFILTNCDIIVNTDYYDALARHIESDAMVTIMSAIKHYKIPYGVVEYSSGGVVTEISEKPEYTFTINTGVYILNKKCFDFIPQNIHFDMPDLIDSVLKEGLKVLTYPVNETDYLDIGEWDEYKKNHSILNDI